MNDSSKIVADETLVSVFRLKYTFNWKYDPTSKKILVSNSKHQQQNSSSTEIIENCLCVLTNKQIILFKICNQELFEQNVDYDKCLRKEMQVLMNKIEIIEIALGQHYLIVQSTTTIESSIKTYLKFITFDSYQTQAFLNTLLKIINESKQFTMLRQIKKKNELTDENLLLELKLSVPSAIIDVVAVSKNSNGTGETNGSFSMPISFYSFLNDFKISKDNLKMMYFY